MPPLAVSEATHLVPVGTAASSESVLRELDPYAAAAFGISAESGTITRSTAMRVPGIRRGRSLICGTVGTLSLTAVRGGVTVRRPLLERLDPNTTPAYLLTWTVDDLLFHGVSWWRVTRRDDQSFPLEVERIARERITILEATDSRLGRVLVDGTEVPDRDLIRFDGVDEGLLKYGATTVRTALALMWATKRVADDDWSGQVLKLAEGAPELSHAEGSAPDGSDRSEIEYVLDQLETSRRTRTTPYLNRAVDLANVGVNARDRSLAELWEQVGTDLARMLNLPASRINAPSGDSLLYSTTEGDRRDMVDTTLAPYLTAIGQRLSLGDVTPTGTVVRFDLSGYVRGSTSEIVTAGVAAIAAGIVDADEVRTEWLGLPPRNPSPEGDPS